jgi:hypothetical protein
VCIGFRFRLRVLLRAHGCKARPLLFGLLDLFERSGVGVLGLILQQCRLLGRIHWCVLAAIRRTQ